MRCYDSANKVVSTYFLRGCAQWTLLSRNDGSLDRNGKVKVVKSGSNFDYIKKAEQIGFAKEWMWV